jgi:hypothetical protein
MVYFDCTILLLLWIFLSLIFFFIIYLFFFLHTMTLLGTNLIIIIIVLNGFNKKGSVRGSCLLKVTSWLYMENLVLLLLSFLENNKMQYSNQSLWKKIMKEEIHQFSFS